MVRPSETSNSTRQSSDFGAVARAYHRIGKPVIPLCPSDHEGVSLAHLAKCSNPGKTPAVPPVHFGVLLWTSTPAMVGTRK